MNNQEKRIFLILVIVLFMVTLMAVVVWKALAMESAALPGWADYRVHGSVMTEKYGLVWELCAGTSYECETRVMTVCLEPDEPSPYIGQVYRWGNGIFKSEGSQDLGLVQIVGVMWGTWLPNVGK